VERFAGLHPEAVSPQWGFFLFLLASVGGGVPKEGQVAVEGEKAGDLLSARRD
jgi:hypothetical protein